MTRAMMVCLAGVLAFAGGCAGDDGDGRAAAPPASSTSPATTTSAVPAMPVAEACSELSLAASAHVMSEITAISSDDHAGTRLGVARAYANFGYVLISDVTRFPGELAVAALDWSKASTDIAEYISTTTPPPGIVVDYGPALDPWRAAKKTAERICGHPLPDTGGG